MTHTQTEKISPDYDRPVKDQPKFDGIEIENVEIRERNEDDRPLRGSEISPTQFLPLPFMSPDLGDIFLLAHFRNKLL